jgi:FtsP/CotA-like multicopper oxidase with cupredoxin domain
MNTSRLLVLVPWIAACGDDVQPEELVPFVDTNPDPDVVEIELVATPTTHEYLPGTRADVWAFRDGAREGSRGTIPGPLLEAKLGDRVIVHFTNELPDATTIHWHGLRVPNAADGTPVSQMPIAAGASYDYEFVLVDPGLYWYHPHVAGDVQVERGLYGPIVVRDDRIIIDVAADRIFVLDDVKLEGNGKLSETTETLDVMLGRQGNVILVNGRQHPTLTASANSRERWRFVNAANGRYFNLALAGHTFRVIGWDGGLVEQPYEVSTLVIAPGERYDVLVELGGTAGDKLGLQSIYYDRGHDVPDVGPIELVSVDLRPPIRPLDPLPSIWGRIDPIEFDASTPRRRLTLREDARTPASPVFTINGEEYPDVTPIRGAIGAIEVWEIENLSEMDHPFHLHGMSFQMLDESERLDSPLGWKDTVNVPKTSTVRFVVRFDAIGRWMYHCHILEHAERGMMGELEVASQP